MKYNDNYTITLRILYICRIRNIHLLFIDPLYSELDISEKLAVQHPLLSHTALSYI